VAIALNMKMVPHKPNTQKIVPLCVLACARLLKPAKMAKRIVACNICPPNGKKNKSLAYVHGINTFVQDILSRESILRKDQESKCLDTLP